ncbi:redoxin family protein [Xanthomonadaceae bacterium JHOS43]|nr:redoxin family protein [Xanthomonadaceae bacterium JHOS43]
MTDYLLAPDLPSSLDWVNCSPQRLAALRGRVTALAFWHAGSATCANMLSDMAYLQARYADGLSVIGMHTPKFDAQRDSARVARAVNRLGVRFPVANDADAVAWQHYGLRGWPAVALLDAQGRLVEIIAGDQQRDMLEERIVQLLHEAGERGLRVYENAQPVSRPEPLADVAFPRALALTPQRLFVSDAGHHRVLECDHAGRMLRVFGSGTAGFADGLGIQAGFHSPCGLAVFKDVLYVADTGNHAIRRIRLATGEVDTLVGQGRNGVPHAVPDVRGAGVLLDQPWGVAAGSDRLHVSLAASNQIWELDLTSFAFRPLAGSGRMVLTDGIGALAAFAQPAGLALAQSTLYVCDSQASALRCVDTASGAVHTLIGHGLFDFGNEEGDRESARLQYPLGVAVDPIAPMLWIADSYNDAIGAWHLEGGGLVRFPLAHRLRGPTAIVSDGARLWIANTDAHEVLCMDIASGRLEVLPMTP